MIFKRLTPTFRLSLGLVGITLSLFIMAVVFGMFPDQEKIELDARASIAEALALQLSNAASQYDTRVLSETIEAVVSRNPNLYSIALRRNDGKILLAAGDHEVHWVGPGEYRSSPTHIQVPLSDESRTWGKIEMSFAPLKAGKRYFGIPATLGTVVLYLASMGFVGYYFVLRRALKELDPGKVVPDRVQSAFNSLAEGILILDERGIILLANHAFAKAVGKKSQSLFGTDVTKLNWRQWGNGARVNEYPWESAVQYHEEITGAKLSYRLGEDEVKNFVVNATCIRGFEGRVSGVISTFDDVTELEQKNDDLEAAVRKLLLSEEEINNQNRELHYLAAHDPLTGCLNRRAFFERFSEMLSKAEQEGTALTCMMADLDHFKKVNDNYGHAVGDQVIIGMATALREVCGDQGLVGRYGGEEFCLVLPSLSTDQSRQAAEILRATVLQRSPSWLQMPDKTVTSSIGVALRPTENCEVGEFVDWADQALYEAKETGRNKVVFWDAINSQKTQSEGLKSEKANEIAAFVANMASSQPAAPVVLNKQAAMEESVVAQSPPPPVTSVSATDPLTGLPSEVIFNDRMTQAITRADWDDKTVALLQISLDSIEEISTTYGEAVCTEFVTIVASRFKSALKRSDTVSTLDGSKRIPSLCRLGTGQFAVEIADLEETNTIIWIVKRLFDSLAAPVTVKDDIFYASSNIGISLYPGDGDDAGTLMRNAATARQYAQKQDGKNNYKFFAEEMNRNSRRQMNLEASIRQALDEDLFVLNYQPIIDTSTGKVKALETLLRSDHPNFSGVPIGSLIAIAEQTGLISEIGEWGLKSAIRQAHTWKSNSIEVPRLSINLSAIQLNDKRAMERIIHILQNMNLPPKKFQFEVTETAILRDSDSAAYTLERIRELGALIALDDFGTGQSSLSYLRRFRPDILKIDRCFIGEITTNHADETLVSAIVSMAQRLHIEVVAEGVETQLQMEKVCDIGCNAIQGFYFARPMPALALTKWLFEHRNIDLVMDSASKQKRYGT